MRRDYRLLATGLISSYQDRKKRIAALNQQIEDAYNLLKSPSLDGIPHNGGGGTQEDKVQRAIAVVERLKKIRGLEQERLNAVDWAYSDVLACYPVEHRQVIRYCTDMICKGKDSAAIMAEIDSADIKPGTLYKAKAAILKSVLTYLGIL